MRSSNNRPGLIGLLSISTALAVVVVAAATTASHAQFRPSSMSVGRAPAAAAWAIWAARWAVRASAASRASSVSISVADQSDARRHPLSRQGKGKRQQATRSSISDPGGDGRPGRRPPGKRPPWIGPGIGPVRPSSPALRCDARTRWRRSVRRRSSGPRPATHRRHHGRAARRHHHSAAQRTALRQGRGAARIRRPALRSRRPARLPRATGSRRIEFDLLAADQHHDVPLEDHRRTLGANGAEPARPRAHARRGQPNFILPARKAQSGAAAAARSRRSRRPLRSRRLRLRPRPHGPRPAIPRSMRSPSFASARRTASPTATRSWSR